MYEEQKQKLKEALGEKDYNDIVSQIESIEKSIPITKNHYGSYMAILSKAPDKRLYANLLIILGANKQGVLDALRCI